MKRWTIYCHTHVDTGRRYVGLTEKTVLQRWNQHIYTAKREARGWSHFANAIRAYGKDAFTHEVLEVCDSLESANEAECRWIERHNTRDPLFGFNLAKGGGHTPHPKRNPWDRPEFRERMSNPSPATRAKLSAAGKGRIPNAATREKMAAAQTGKAVGAETRAKLAALRTGKTHSPETRAKLADANRRRSPEAMASIAAALTGKRHSPETKARLAALNTKTVCKRGHEMGPSVDRVSGGCPVCSRSRKAAWRARHPS